MCYDNRVYPSLEGLRMKHWLRIAVLTLCLLMTAAFAEDAAENVVIYFNDGAMVLLPAGIADDEQKLADYCNQYFPGRIYARDPEAFVYSALISEKWTETQFGPGSKALSVTLAKLGVYSSVVTTVKGEEMNVPTAELTIRGFADKTHHVAVVSAPRTGTASLRDKASGSGKVLAKCAAGSIVPVLECTSATYTKILYDGVEGYIRTDCLVFQDTAKAPVGTGMLHIKDAVDGKDDVTIRNTASKSSSKVAAVPTGTEVSVYGSEGDWYIVEGDGWLGYIQKQYVKIAEE